jgi:DNA repair protein RadC
MIVATARDAADLLVPLFESAKIEKVVAAYLDGDRRLLLTLETEKGGHDAVDLPIRAILIEALRLGAAGLIVAHNHPSGDATPSPADLAATRELAATANSLGIQLFDHLIFGGSGECRSLRASGLL